MKRAERDAWVAALRSGEYQQGVGTLRSAAGYCCLGVAAEVVLKCEWVDKGLGRFTAQVGDHVLATDLAPRLGSRKPDLLGLTYEQQNEVMGMNDAGHSFAEIADWVEANIPVDDGDNP